MHADATFVIGARHEVCEDWAAAGDAWALVCDGCSSSPRSDFGARLIGRAAERSLALGQLCPAHVVEAAAEQARNMALPARCLDATLLAAWHDPGGGCIRALAMGDGVIAARRRDGSLEAWSIEHPDGAPAYPSYLIDDERLGHYLRSHGRRRVVHHFDGPTRPRQTVVVQDEHLSLAPWCLRWAFPLSRYDMVAVMSDGATALRTPDGSTLSLGDSLRELLAFRRHRGRFVRRRVRGALRKCGWQLGDDLAMAAIWAPNDKLEAA
jgi:Protein phosphatase 2C